MEGECVIWRNYIAVVWFIVEELKHPQSCLLIKKQAVFLLIQLHLGMMLFLFPIRAKPLLAELLCSNDRTQLVYLLVNIFFNCIFFPEPHKATFVLMTARKLNVLPTQCVSKYNTA